MIFKVALLFSCLAVGVWEGSALNHLKGRSRYVSNSEYKNYHQATPQYDFSYNVRDLSYGGPSHGATESRRGARTTGSYFVDVPGSQTQKVSYVVDGRNYAYKPVVSYQKKYVPKVETHGYNTRKVYLPKAKEVSYTKSVIRHPRPLPKLYTQKPKASSSPKREISYSRYPVSHSNIRNYHSKSYPTAYSKSKFFYPPKTAVSHSTSKIYHPKPSYTTVHKARPIKLKEDSAESESEKEDSQEKGATISKLPSTQVTYQPILIKTYKPVYQVKYKPVYKRQYHH